MFPTLSEWIAHDRITVGPPFFNKAMAPIGLVLLFLTGVGPLIAWRKASAENLQDAVRAADGGDGGDGGRARRADAAARLVRVDRPRRARSSSR